MRRKCERRRGNINADAAGAEVFAGDGCSQGASFGPMAAISQRWRGGRIYNNTRTRERLRRKCVKPRRPHNPFPAEDLLPPPHSDTPFPSTFAPPRSADARPPTSPPIPRRRSAPAPAQRRALPLPSCHIPAAQTHARRLRHAFLADPTTHSPPKAFAPPPPFRFGHKKNGTAQWMCDAECLGRPSLRSVIGVGEPRAVRRRYGALAWRVGLRPQPWALRSRRCGRVLRA